MSTDIVSLDPKPVWQHFYELTQIPRPSKHESAVIEFVRKFGEDLGLDTTGHGTLVRVVLPAWS